MVWRFHGHCSGGRMGESFEQEWTLCVHFCNILFGNECQEVMLPGERKAVSDQKICAPGSKPPHLRNSSEEKGWPGTLRPLHTHQNSGHSYCCFHQVLLWPEGLSQALNMHSEKVVCDQLCFTWTDFTAFSFYLLRVFAGILFRTMDFLTFLFGDVAGAQHTLHDSKGPEIRMPRFTMGVCFAIWNTNYEKREKEEKVHQEKVCSLATSLWISIWLLCLKQCLCIIC